MLKYVYKHCYIYIYDIVGKSAPRGKGKRERKTWCYCYTFLNIQHYTQKRTTRHVGVFQNLGMAELTVSC